MITFENDWSFVRLEFFRLSCHNIGVKPSLFDKQQQNLNLPNGPYRYDVVVGKVINNIQQMITLKKIQVNVLNVIKLKTSSLKAHHTKLHKVKQSIG